MRLMSPSEVTDTLIAVRQNFPGLLDECVGLFWTDDNSNYAGVFLAAPLLGRVFFLDHDDPNDAPRFRSLDSFCHSMLAAAEQDQPWVEMATDYPRLTDPMDPASDEDRTVAMAYLCALDAAHSPDEYSRFAHRALHLLPPLDFELALPLLGSADMWVQERACAVIGLWRRPEAVPDLLRVGQTGMHNGRVAAVRALQRIRTPGARNAVSILQAEMGSRYEWLFRRVVR
jgi:hypothetical protein